MHLVFSLSENSFIWSKLRSKLRQFLAFKGLLNEFLCALLLQSGKAVDFKTYVDLLLTYCSCAPRIQFVRKSIFWSKLRSKLRNYLAYKGLLNEFLCALLLQSGKAVDFKTYACILLTYCSCATRIQYVRKSIYLVKFEVKN